MKIYAVILSSLLSVVSVASNAEIVEFRIPAGTQNNSWNTQETPIVFKVGDTIRIFNDDSTLHRLHTNGAPCGHGPDIKPGKSWDCLAKYALSSTQDGPLYDHYAGETAEVWFETAQ